MKNKVLLCIIMTVCSLSAFSFTVARRFAVDTPNRVVKFNDTIGMELNGFYEIKDINTFIAGSDGWYKVSFCGEELYVVFGSAFFMYLWENSPSFVDGDSFLKVDGFDEYIKNEYKWYPHPNNLFWSISHCIKSIEVPDVLEETIDGEVVIYDTHDMMHFYIVDPETHVKRFRYNARPWATSKDPIGMKVRMNLNESLDKIVILNGYVHPRKRHLYKANRRLKTVRITSPEEDFEVLEKIEDVVHFHEIDLPRAVKIVDIEILDYYEGEKYRDLCVQMFGKKDFYDDYTSQYVKETSFNIYKSWGYKPWGKEYKEQ